MADHSKASAHHAKAGKAFARGDVKAAAHHMGHALAALRSAKPKADPIDPDLQPLAPEVEPSANMSGLRSRLKGFKP